MNKQAYKGDAQEKRKYERRGAIGAFLSIAAAGALLYGLTNKQILKYSLDCRLADLKATAAQVEANSRAYEQKQRTNKDISYVVSKAEKEKER